MKKIVFISLLLSACQIQPKETLNSMQPPIIVVAIEPIGSDVECDNSGAVVLKDAFGKLYQFGCYSDIAKAVSNSRCVGDTL